MRVLFLPLNWGTIVQSGWYDAFRESGAVLEIFDFMSEYQNNRKRAKATRDKLLEKARNFKPDMLFMQIQHTTVVDPGTIRTIKRDFPNCKIVNWTGDVRVNVPVTYLRMAGISDLNLISSTGQLEMFKKSISKPVKYLQIGYNPKLYYPEEKVRTNFDWDVTFVAHFNAKEQYPGRAEREAVVRQLREAFGNRFCLFGDGWHKRFKSKGSIDQPSVASVYHNSLCTISVSHFNDISHYFSDRLLLCMASGRPVISYRFPQWQSYFTNKCDLIIADKTEDIVEHVKWLKDNPERANMIGKAGAAKVKAEHTYLSRVEELYDMINSI